MKQVKDRSLEDVPVHLRQKVAKVKNWQKSAEWHRTKAHEYDTLWRNMVYGFVSSRDPLSDQYDPELLEWMFYLMGVDV